MEGLEKTGDVVGKELAQKRFKGLVFDTEKNDPTELAELLDQQIDWGTKVKIAYADGEVREETSGQTQTLGEFLRSSLSLEPPLFPNKAIAKVSHNRRRQN